MNHHTDGLWQGGPWEQSAQAAVPRGAVPPPAAYLPPREYRRPPAPPRRRSGKVGFLVMLLLIGGLTSLAVVINGGIFSSSPSHSFGSNSPDSNFSHLDLEEDNTTPPSIPQAPTGSGVELTVSPAQGDALTHTQVYEKNAPSIVSLEAYSSAYVSTGTGIVMTQDGYIITNAHIVAGAYKVNVVLPDDSIWPAKQVGFEPDEDLAVLKIEADGLTPAEFGDSTQLRCGDQVSAIGNPLGYRSTITPGIVSALDQTVEVDEGTMYLIQTSAAINFGSSGGALINDHGQVIGITTIKIVADDGSAEALSFAIPMTRVKQVVDRLIAGLPIQHPALGITVRRSQTDTDGLVVEELSENSDCLAQGMEKWDIIVAANGNTVRTNRDLERVKRALNVGDTILLEVVRDGEHLEFEVHLKDSSEF